LRFSIEITNSNALSPVAFVVFVKSERKLCLFISFRDYRRQQQSQCSPVATGEFGGLGQWRTQKIFMGGVQSAKIFLCIKIESMIRKNIKQAAIQYANVVKQL